MKSYKHIILLLALVLSLSGCGTAKKVPQYATISGTPDLSKYKYVYIHPTTDKTSVSGGVYGGQYGVYGNTSSKSVNPSDIVAGKFIKSGYSVVPDINKALAGQTIIVNIAETGRKQYNILSYSIEMTIQLLDASTYELICNVSAEGMGETEADDVRKAILKCLDAIFR